MSNWARFGLFLICGLVSTLSRAAEWRDASAKMRFASLERRANNVKVTDHMTSILGRDVREFTLHPENKIMRCGDVESGGIFAPSYIYCQMDQVATEDVEQFEYPSHSEVRDGNGNLRLVEIIYTAQQKVEIRKNDELNKKTDVSFSGASARLYFDRLMAAKDVDALSKYVEKAGGSNTQIIVSIPELRCVALRVVDSSGVETVKDQRCRVIDMKASDLRSLRKVELN